MSRCAPDGKIFYSSNFHGENAEGKKIRTVLHCDGNAFYASCESIAHPEYKTVPFAVCGSEEDRHGIVLAKNELAKKFGVQTGETVWKAKQKCPSLVTVRPTYGLYSDISQKMNRIFYDYTDLVEPFGLDESWLDVTGSIGLFGSGRDIAEDIRERIKRELKITVSVGVSFNKIFAKLGSDLKKPDAVSVISYDDYKNTVWGLPVEYLLFIGRSCGEKLHRVGIKTIGDLALTDRDFMSRYLGKNGLMLRDFALGRDYSPVTPMGYEPEPKSVSNGMTFRRNLVSENDISFAVNYLAGSVAERLRKHGMLCTTVAVSMRLSDLSVIIRQAPLETPTCLCRDIARSAMRLIESNRRGEEELYSITVHAEKLRRGSECDLQQSFFPSESDLRYEKLLSLETAVDRIKARYGKSAVRIASSINNGLI